MLLKKTILPKIKKQSEYQEVNKVTSYICKEVYYSNNTKRAETISH